MTFFREGLGDRFYGVGGAGVARPTRSRALMSSDYAG